MRKRRRILMVAAALIAISVIDLLMIDHLGLAEGEPAIIRWWRFFLTLLLSLFLALGKNSARWLTIILSGLGALGGFTATAILLASGNSNSPDGRLLLAWGVFTTVSYSAIAAFLAYSSGVAREIRRIAEQID